MGGNLVVTALRGLDPGVPIVDSAGAPTPAFVILMQQITSGLANSSGASMPAPPPVYVFADYSNTPLAGQLPKAVQVQRISDGTDVSDRSRWFLTTLSGSISATISQAGVVTITALGSNSVLQVQSNRDGVNLTCNVTVNLQTGAIPANSPSVSTFSSIADTTGNAITTTITITTGASGTVTLAAPLDVSTIAASPIGTFPVYGKWQWFNGTSWVDVAAEVASSPNCNVTRSLDPQTHVYSYVENDGSLTVNTSKTGLTPGSSQQFRLWARNSSGTRTIYFGGTASATTS